MCHQITLGCLWFTCHLLDVLICTFLGQLSDFASISQKKKQNISLCRILAVSCGYYARLICASTSLYHSSAEQPPCLKLVNRLNLALTSFVCDLQNSSNLFQMTFKHNSSEGKHQNTYRSIPKSPDQAITSCIFLSLQALQVHIPICFHILTSISGTCCIDYH